MRISVDISLYPLTEEYVEPILQFIEKLEANNQLVIKRNCLATQVFGEYREVMDCLDAEIEAVFDKLPHSVFVMKLIGTDRHAMTEV